MWTRSIVITLWVLFVIGVNGVPCDFVVSENPACLFEMDCTTGGHSLKIFENCPTGTVLFNFTAGSMKADGVCHFLEVDTGNNQLKMKESLDAENFVMKQCEITTDEDGKATLTYAEDLNEFSPQPVDGNRVQEINVDENLTPRIILNFAYKDDDKDETQKLTITLLTSDVEDVFGISGASGSQGMEFTLSTKIPLDYEARMFYKIEFDITSTDSSNNILTTKHTVFVYVQDVGDNPPYWLESHPIATLSEGPADREVYRVRAEDRDLMINNKVKYSFVSGNEEGFFELDETTGVVTLVNDIDRENDTSFFILEIKAQEYDVNDNIAPEPNNSVTVTNLNIVDVNDNVPTFSQLEYEINMDEVDSVDVFMGVDIYVLDMDPEGSNGRYIITSDKPDDVKITPSDSFGNSTLQLTALFRSDTIFDYETTRQVTITLTATEKADASHIGTAILIINLIDVNDNIPEFAEVEYEVNVKEDAGKGYSLVTVSATDGDFSDEFGTQSIRYKSGCTILEVNNATGEVTLGQNNALDYEAEPEVICDIYADDNQGNAPTNPGSTTLKIIVSDVVDSPPLIVVNDAEIEEGSPHETAVGQLITATDKDVDANIEFYINWESSTATSNGQEVNINNIDGWFEIVQLAPAGQTYSAQLKVGPNTTIDRETADKVRLSVVVNDTKTESGASADSGFVIIDIKDVKDTTPVINPMFGLTVTENSPYGTLITTIVAVDPDLDESLTFSISDESVVYLEKSPVNDYAANLRVSANSNIDREEEQLITVNITVTDSVGLNSTRQFEIIVMDVNDNAPTFEDDVILASFTENDVSGKVIQTFEAKDVDLNVTLTYSLAGDFEWNEGGPVPPPTEPFLIQTANNIASLILNFNPLGINSGFCNFTIVCHDNDGNHSASVQGKVYAITIAYQINVIFSNPPSAVQSQSSKIANIFSDVYGYPCIIDSIAENLPSRASKEATETLVKMHFIDESKDEPVATEVIVEATNDAELAQELFDRMNALGLTLQMVGNNIVTDNNKTDSQVLLLQILLAVVSLVLGSFLLLLLITYCVRTRRLERQLRVAKATTFGSTSSNLNRVDLVGVPGSNKFAGEGANPMYNVAETDIRNDDASSTSGDSVLVGVEENPEFREYASVKAPVDPKGTFNSSYDNASFSRSIDDIAGPSPFAGGSRTNPLLDADLGDNDFDLADARENYDAFVRRTSGSSGESFGASTNPNFSFGPTN